MYKGKFPALNYPLSANPDEIFNYFVNVKDNLTIETDLCIELTEHGVL